MRDHIRMYQMEDKMRDIPVKRMQEMIFLYNAIQDGWKVWKDRERGKYVLVGKKMKGGWIEKIEHYIKPN